MYSIVEIEVQRMWFWDPLYWITTLISDGSSFYVPMSL
jgi:hypothetical protein